MSRISELQDQIRVGEQWVALQDAVTRLSHNNDFRKLQQYFDTKVTDSVSGLSELPQDDYDYKEAIRTLDAISRIRGLVSEIESKAESAQGDIREARRYLGESED